MSLDVPEIREPVVHEPVIQEPVLNEPEIVEPSIREPIIREPIVLEPPINLPAPLSNGLGFGLETLVIDMPGCVKARDYEIGSPGHFDTDPAGTYILCDNSQPVFYPADYYKGVKVIPRQPPTEQTENQSKQSTAPPQTQVSTVPPNPPERLPCPTPEKAAQYPVGSIGKFGRARVKEYREDLTTGECITIWEQIPVLETVNHYTPPPSLVSGVMVTALFGATAALAASPLNAIIQKKSKGLQKKIIKAVKKKLGQKEQVLSTSEKIRAQREKRATDLMWRSLMKK